MTSHALESVALMLVAEGKGILAADETVPTLTKRFDALGIRSTEESRRTYREMLFTTPGAAEFISQARCLLRGTSRWQHDPCATAGRQTRPGYLFDRRKAAGG